MVAKKVYRIYIERDSELFKMFERIPRSLRGEYVREAMMAFNPFFEARKGEPAEKVSKKPANKTKGSFGEGA